MEHPQSQILSKRIRVLLAYMAGHTTPNEAAKATGLTRVTARRYLVEILQSNNWPVEG
jgi:response regulator of citrate/malate metabolism